MGLSSGTSATTPTALPFAIRLQAGVAEVRESGIYRAEVRFSAGDRFQISAENGVVRYLKNGAVFYTSRTVASAAMRIQAIFCGLHGTISQVTLGG